MGVGNWSIRSFAGFEDAIVLVWDRWFRERDFQALKRCYCGVS